MGAKQKNQVIQLLAIAWMVLGLTGLTGCGSKPLEVADPGGNQTNTATSKPWSSLEEFFGEKETEKLEELKATMNDTIDETLGVGGEIDVRVQGNELAYIFKFGPEVDTVGLKESLDLAMDSMESVFVGVANTLKASTSLDKILVTVKYVDGEGQILTSRTFQSNNEPLESRGNHGGDDLNVLESSNEAGSLLPNESAVQEVAPQDEENTTSN